MQECETCQAGRPWIESEMRFLQRNYAKRGPRFCAVSLGRSEVAVIQFATKKLNLKFTGRTRSADQQAKVWTTKADPSPDEIEILKAEIREQHFARKRSAEAADAFATGEECDDVG